MTTEELYGIFGKYGAVYQIRLGEKSKDTRGTAFVVYEDIYDAKAAVDHLSGFNVAGKYFTIANIAMYIVRMQIEVVLIHSFVLTFLLIIANKI